MTRKKRKMMKKKNQRTIELFNLKKAFEIEPNGLPGTGAPVERGQSSRPESTGVRCLTFSRIASYPRMEHERKISRSIAAICSGFDAL